MKRRRIKDNHVLVIGAGSSIKKYKNEILRFIEKNDPVTFACNYIDNIVIPHYHLWNSTKRLNLFSESIDKSSRLIFWDKFPKKKIKKRWDGPYDTFKCVVRRWKPGWKNKNSKEYRRCKVYYKNGKMFGCFRDAVILAIFYSYIKKASKISIVGMDGYMFGSKKGDKSMINAHCYEEGLETKMKIKQMGYEYYKDLDIENNVTLKLLYEYVIKKYGFGFEILTPTVHEKFYNSNILNIR